MNGKGDTALIARYRLLCFGKERGNVRSLPDLVVEDRADRRFFDRFAAPAGCSFDCSGGVRGRPSRVAAVFCAAAKSKKTDTATRGAGNCGRCAQGGHRLSVRREDLPAAQQESGRPRRGSECKWDGNRIDIGWLTTAAHATERGVGCAAMAADGYSSGRSTSVSFSAARRWPSRRGWMGCTGSQWEPLTNTM